MFSRRHFINLCASLAGGTAVGVGLSRWTDPALAQGAAVTLPNASYDPTGELHTKFNAAFAKYWKAKAGQDVNIKRSHGGSGEQARSVIDGPEADVVTRALASEIDALAVNGKLVPADWQKRLKANCSTYTATIVFLVRKGNPKAIRDWNDLVRPGVAVITPNPKTSGGARWNYLAAWEFAKHRFGSDAQAQDFVARLYRNVPVLDAGARGSTITFYPARHERRAARLGKRGKDGGVRIRCREVRDREALGQHPCRTHVALVDKDVDKKGKWDLVEADLGHLYSDDAKDIAGRSHFRPTGEKAGQKYAARFQNLKLFTIAESFGNWTLADKRHFADGASFDQIYTAK